MKLLDLYKEFSKTGFPVPFIQDAITEKPSMTLTFAFVSFLICCTGIIFLIARDLTVGTITSLLFWVICMVFYRMRKLDKFKIDLDDRTIELDGGDEEENGPKE